MATCKDCDRQIVCRYYTQWANVEQVETDRCQYFKNKADFVEVNRGKWETRNFIIFDSEKVGYRCTECNTTWDTETNYCPNCGADMRKEGARIDNR